MKVQFLIKKKCNYYYYLDVCKALFVPTMNLLEIFFLMVIGMITMCSLQITPACNLPLKSLRGGGKIIIVNLQVLDPLFPANCRPCLAPFLFVTIIIIGLEAYK